MGEATERVKKGFSETRTIILGAQILLGFQYDALFQPEFDALPGWARLAAPATFALLTASMACMITPTPLHRVGEGGRATGRLCASLDLLLLVSLLPFAAAMALEIAVSTSRALGPVPGAAVGAAGALLALFVWFGLGWLGRERTGGPRTRTEDEDMSLKDRISEVLEQSRIVLPGVQALLGFQFAGYLTDGFKKLPEASKAAHTGALLLLLLAMMLLMAPTPYHRISARGEPTEAVDRVGTRFVLLAMIPLALAVAADFYIVLQKVTESAALGIAGAAAVIVGCAVLWLIVPLLFRVRPGRG